MPKLVQIFTSEIAPLHPQLLRVAERNAEPVHLDIKKALSKDEMSQLSTFIDRVPFPLASLSLHLNRETLINPRFLELIRQLNATPITEVEFIFSEDHLHTDHNDILAVLNHQIAPTVTYPLQIRSLDALGIKPSDLELQDFQRTIIANIQKRNKQALEINETKNSSRMHAQQSNQGKRKLKLKDYIKEKASKAELKRAIPLEIQHVEMLEQQIEQQHQEVVEVQTNLELNTVQEYGGQQLLGYAEFSTPLYKNKVLLTTNDEKLSDSLYALLKQELFANLPHAIKYLSPAAAEHLANNLAAFVTLNKENLPHGFILKQTKAGEFVLDYDEYLENEQANAYTPVTVNGVKQAIYDVQFSDPEAIPQWLSTDRANDKHLLNYFGYAKQPYASNLKQLTNMWIRYGDEGLTHFFQELTTKTQTSPDLLPFLLNSYLAHFPQWENLHNNRTFFHAVEKIAYFDNDKRSCFERFLVNTGSSQHNLSTTVIAFEHFWNEVNQLCIQQNIPISGINAAEWTTPVGGNPTVYMQRMLLILKNARNLSDQFTQLKNISLGNYDAYYASHYENFKIVSSAMHLNYQADEQDKQSFNQNFKLYHEDLNHLMESLQLIRRYTKYKETLIQADDYTNEEEENPYWLISSASHPLPPNTSLTELKAANLAVPFNTASRAEFTPPKQLYTFFRGQWKVLHAEEPRDVAKETFYAACYRFLGLQEKAVSVSSVIQDFQKYNTLSRNYTEYLLTFLLFASHERAKEGVSLEPLWDLLDAAGIHKKEVLDTAIADLAKLYQLDIKLNQHEGFILFEAIAWMNSSTYEWTGLKKTPVIHKLFAQLEQNKFASLKLLDFRANGKEKKDRYWPILYALDTTAFLAQDEMIAHTYRDDLLLFSELINGESNPPYYDRVFTDKKEDLEIQENIKKAREILHEAASSDGPSNLRYAIQVMINARIPFSFSSFIKACEEIQTLPTFEKAATDAMLLKHQFKIGFAALPAVFTKDNADIRGLMSKLLLELNLAKDLQSGISENTESKKVQLFFEYMSLDFDSLQEKLDKAWKENGTLLSISGTKEFQKILDTTLEVSMNSAFKLPDVQGLLKVVAGKIRNLSDFQECRDFDKANRISNGLTKIASMCSSLLSNPNVLAQESKFADLFLAVDFSKFDYETMYSLLSLVGSMPERDYFTLLKNIIDDKAFCYQKDQILSLLSSLTNLNNHYLPSTYLETFSHWVMAHSDKDFDEITRSLIDLFDKDPKDPFLELLMTHPELTYEQITQLLKIGEQVSQNRPQLSAFFLKLIQSQTLDVFLGEFNGIEAENQPKILAILSKANAFNHTKNKLNSNVDYQELTTLLHHLSIENLEHLHAFYETSPASAHSLFNSLKNFSAPENFELFLEQLEKNPFGERDLQGQFSIDEVERIVNQSKDLLNDSVYTVQYRKQWMDAFLFVNEIGQHLPVYYNKPAKDLSNAEIKAFFADLKAKKIEGTPFQNRLLALGLMREAMYRNTGEFPYSTQMLNLIDGMMHSGDFISNIDTGQGKSLTDSMKGALLWLDSDRVEITTSSLVDAKRDIMNYGPFFRSLGIPYTDSPISSVSPIDNFQKEGINFSTFAQLSLFFAKAKVAGTPLDTPDTKVSLIVNESDYTLLDDRVVYRFAIDDGSGIGKGQEWIYYAINEFVGHPAYVENNTTSIEQDVTNLKAHLHAKAKELNKSEKIINKFSQEQYESWIESSLMVNYLLKENEDYVIPEELEKKIINGIERQFKVVKVLMDDDKVSPDSTFGNGIQQLLYAHLNQKQGKDEFLIGQQYKTIISAVNTTLLNYYRSRKGFIWGSSGTVGSRNEINELYSKYGFDFSKAQPHQTNKVRFNDAIIKNDEEAQFNELISRMTTWQLEPNTSPSLVFCKDIDTAKRLYAALQEKNPKAYPSQLYIGLGNEEEAIKRAANPGMITITTSALGRNTDIAYDKEQGLRVWHTYVGSIRKTGQQSGRTGRQGSAGEVNFIFNTQELNNKSIADIQAEIDEFARIERDVNNILYQALGYLITEIDHLPEEQFLKGKSNFLREVWSKFSTSTEILFRESHREADYSNQIFIEKTFASFNDLMRQEVKSPIEVDVSKFEEAIAHQYTQKDKYVPYSKPVKIENSTPPYDLAYHMLEFKQDDAPSNSQEMEEDIVQQLNKLFERIQKGTFTSENRDYLRYLTQTPRTQEIVVNAHRRFLREYLDKHSPKLNFIQKWLGYEQKLKHIANNKQYLLMFHALSHLKHKDPLVDNQTIKKAVKNLLKDYLDTSWFINSNRKKWAKDLLKEIDKKQDVESIISCLARVQMDVAKKDILTNKQRWVKSLHHKGSRFQDCLSSAFNLASSLSGISNADDLVTNLTPFVAEVTDKIAIRGKLTTDILEEKASSIKKEDKGNAAVLINILKNALSIKKRQLSLGMEGRPSFFSSPKKAPSAPVHPDKTNDNSSGLKK